MPRENPHRTTPNSSPAEETSVDAVAEQLGSLLDIDREDDQPTDDEPQDDREDLDEDEPQDDEEEDERSEDDEEEEDGDDEDEGGEEEQKLYRVKSDGEELEVTLDELLNGYSRTSHFTKKSQALAEEKRQFDAIREEVNQRREEYATRLDALQEALDSMSPKEPDWDKLRQERPQDFPAVFAEWQMLQQQKAAVESERQRVADEKLAAEREKLQKAMQTEWELLREKMPAFKDEEKGRKILSDIRTYALDLGAPEQIVDNIRDHLTIVTLYKAMKYDKLQAKKGTVSEKVKKVQTLKPGSPKARGEGKRKQLRDAEARLKKSGRPEDAAALIESLIDL